MRYLAVCHPTSPVAVLLEGDRQDEALAAFLDGDHHQWIDLARNDAAEVLPDVEDPRDLSEAEFDDALSAAGGRPVLDLDAEILEHGERPNHLPQDWSLWSLDG
ncbi:hypothetical protein [Desulfurivibrio alkaliphilus]|uniref:Uncharacterized protein n=1 Tax=Desulfurivibrio alkaliphilus (strain DSM 19089 / UNIQEM U267 / AHT2) TaxID=589865 RepID=D6Z5J3_DESAT|nr:hypothetical protein [Desulfurivibrio alkaliphilus]ADH86730.1 hypothetical protein DaAHT2_2056 [Desulfurivibrio alkaliphilus AHT 2]